MEDKKEYILCAAWLRKVSKEAQPYHEGLNDICSIELGYRHHDIYMRFPDEMKSCPKAQGFYTSKGRFVDRYEGMEIAYNAGQVSEYKALNKSYLSIPISINGSTEPLKDTHKFNQLFSEDLY